MHTVYCVGGAWLLRQTLGGVADAWQVTVPQFRFGAGKHEKRFGYDLALDDSVECREPTWSSEQEVGSNGDVGKGGECGVRLVNPQGVQLLTGGSPRLPLAPF